MSTEAAIRLQGAMYRMSKLERAYNALDNLQAAGISMTGPDADAVDNAMAALERKISEALIELYDEENK